MASRPRARLLDHHRSVERSSPAQTANPVHHMGTRPVANEHKQGRRHGYRDVLVDHLWREGAYEVSLLLVRDELDLGRQGTSPTAGIISSKSMSSGQGLAGK